MPARKNIEKKEKSIIDDLLDKVGLVDFKETMGQVVDYIEDFFTNLFDSIAKLVPTPVKDWVKKNLFSTEKDKKNTKSINEIYNKLNLNWKEKPNFLPFYLAMQWYNKQKSNLWNSKYLTVIDYSKPIDQNRLYVINMQTLTIEHCVKTWHGKNSGNKKTTSSFSNTFNSNQTSIGFFRTPYDLTPNSRKTWNWLFLDWLEYSNSNARKRWIAVHAVWDFFYWSNGKWHKAGDSTSEWCITIRTADNPKEIMNKIKWDSIIYSYYPDMTYLNKSTLIK